MHLIRRNNETLKLSGRVNGRVGASSESVQVFQAFLQHMQFLLKICPILDGTFIFGSKVFDLFIIEFPDNFGGEPGTVVVSN